MENNESKHEYDGIHEDNHPAPRWWVNLFIISILWGAGYFYYYSVFDGETLRHKLDRELTVIEGERLKTAALGPNEEELLAVVSDSTRVKAGKEIYAGKCVSCHGDQGQGIIGPNLADAYWLNGKGSASDIFKVVDKGVPDKGMPPWGPLLTSVDLRNVVAFVKTFQGTKPTNPKAPQGAEVKP